MTNKGQSFNSATSRTPELLCQFGALGHMPPSAPAICCDNLTLTYDELNARIAQAHGAFVEFGLLPGDRIVLLLPTSPEFVIAYFAAHRAGLVVIPLNPLLGTAELDFILSSMLPSLIVISASSADMPAAGYFSSQNESLSGIAPILCFGSSDDEIVSLDVLMERADPTLPSSPRGLSEEVLILFTSGTSGRPKGASLVQQAVINNTRYSNETLGITTQDTLLCPLPLSHVFGQMVLMLGALMAGAALVLVPRANPKRVLEAMSRTAPTLMAAVPTTFAALADLATTERERASQGCRRLRCALTGGAPLSGAIAEAFERAFGRPLHKGYGMTEVGCCIALENVNKPPTPGVGRISDFLDFRVVPLADDSLDRGELELRGSNIFRGYYIDGILTPRQSEEWFPTGDLVQINDDGTITIFDRRKELVIRGGYNVYPSEVEAVLLQHPDVQLAAVVGVEDAKLGQEVAAFLQLVPGTKIEPAELADWCRARIALYKYPRLMAVMAKLPTNPTGKIVKRDLDRTLLRPVATIAETYPTNTPQN
ncbi:class I adenylate-forming enzyme family protein [Gimibacter soli]|uniref:AMP-binding protein n=1 Tax=Gimibacter soli TaxID=3024400 RepID=A0AAE9XUX0_9PROT|nr:AMP-binding protein [Gimibacter soli]WCL55596.1 AMP-binding protein [Gimibacter soli]